MNKRSDSEDETLRWLGPRTGKCTVTLEGPRAPSLSIRDARYYRIQKKNVDAGVVAAMALRTVEVALSERPGRR